MKTVEELSGYDKAAIIYEILGDSVAVNMFSDIPEATLYELRKHSNRIRRDVSIHVKKEVLGDYYFKMLSVEKYKQVSLNSNMFDFLNNLDDERLYALLSNEKPRVIALSLEQIENKRRMPLLLKLDPEIQTQIVLQTGNLKDIPLETVIHLAKNLKKKASFLPGPVEFSRGGGKSVSDMLSNMSEDDAEQYLNKMKLDNPDLFTEVKQYFLLFDDIIKMPEKMALDFWGDPDISLDMMAKALKEFDAETVKKIQGYLPGKKQAMFNPIGEEESLPKREIDEAKGIIKKFLQKKIAAGEMNIEDILATGS